MAVRQLIVDSLRYWAKEMHVDGFRFDLASIFARNSDGTINTERSAHLRPDRRRPGLWRTSRLIAEPWDAGGAYQLGRRFPGLQWMQWNASYRDTMQRFVRGDPGMVAELMTRLYGSSDLFPDDRYHACGPFRASTTSPRTTASRSTIWSPTTEDATGPTDTTTPTATDDYSWNCGWEGDDGSTDGCSRLRKQQVKNFFCLLMLSNGTPMFRMGDEFLQTQQGNNNPYNQDNETSWLDWSRLDEHSRHVPLFRQMIAFRKAHPSLSRSRFWRDDVSWYGVDQQSICHWLAQPGVLPAWGLAGRHGYLRDDQCVVERSAIWYP